VPPTAIKRLKVRRRDTCAGCAADVAVGDTAGWDTTTRTLWCVPCLKAGRTGARPDGPDAPPPPTTAATSPGLPTTEVHPAAAAGGSAAREYAQRAARREARIRGAHPRLGGLILALATEPQHQQAWATGARGERAVGAKLDELVSDDLLVLHDRRMRDEQGRVSKANIDHLLVAASGVWVVDAKAYKGSLEVRRAGGLFTPRVEQLWIGDRNRTPLVEGVQRQVRAVQRELQGVQADIPVRAAMCFVGTELPWFGSSSIGGIALVGRRGLRKLVLADGDLEADDREAVAVWLAARFPPA
jgi:hypothetical protein